MIHEIITPNEEAYISAFIAVISVIPLIIGFFKVLWRSAKSLFVNPSSLQNNILTDTIDQTLLEDASESTTANTNNIDNEHEIKQSLLDPCGIMNQVDYFNFIEDPDVNYFASFFRLRKFKVQMIPGFIIILTVLAYVIWDGLDSFYFQKTGNIPSYVIRTFVYCFSIPFLMIFNCTGLFMNYKKTKEKHSFINIMWILVSLAYLIFIVVGIIFVCVCRAKFTTFVPKNLVYSESSKPVTISEPASICETKYYGLNLIQYAGLSALAQSTDVLLADEILQYLFDGSLKETTIYSSKMLFLYETIINEKLLVVSLNSLINIYGVSFIMENYFNDFIPSKLFGAIIPFYELAYDLLLSRFLNLMSNELTIIVGVPQVTVNYVEHIHDIYNIFGKSNKTIVYTGHSIGGLLAKSMGSFYHVPSVAFESLNYYHSLFSAAMTSYSSHIEFITNGFQMINVYSPSQLFAQVESNSTMNIELPKWKGSLDYINPYDSTCLIAAGCAVDGRYDGFCDNIMGIEQYKYLFSLWNRTRSDMN